MNITEVKNWLKEFVNVPVTVGTIDGNKEMCVGVFADQVSGNQRICLGGLEQTKYAQKNITVLVHWNTNYKESEAKAQEVYNLFYGNSQFKMGDTMIYSCDPGASLIPVGKDKGGVYEFVIKIKLLHERR